MTAPAWPLRCAARHAIVRCYSVAYDAELTAQELRGMRLIERGGEVTRDIGWSNRPHWHRVHPPPTPTIPTDRTRHAPHP